MDLLLLTVLAVAAPLLTDERYIRVPELQRMFGVSRATLWRMRKRGELPEPVRISRGVIGWRASVIAEFFETKDNFNDDGRA